MGKWNRDYEEHSKVDLLPCTLETAMSRSRCLGPLFVLLAEAVIGGRAIMTRTSLCAGRALHRTMEVW